MEALKLFNVGIAKSGTTSIAGIFSRFRSAHEFWFQEAAEALGDLARGDIDREGLREFLRRRDAAGNLEVDSCSLNGFYADILAAEFPAARFVHTIRDPFSWLESMLNMILNRGSSMPDWVFDFGQTVFGSKLERPMLASRQSLIDAVPDLIDDALRYWRAANQFVLDTIPDDRRLTIRTDEISTSLGELATFAGIDEDQLVSEKSHLFRLRAHACILNSVDGSLLRDRFDKHCQALSQTFFPDTSLESCLEANFDAMLAEMQ